VGDRALADADEAWFQELAIQWLGTRRSEFDPQVMDTVTYLGGAPDAVLARAVRDVAPSAVQAQLLRAFADRNPEGALALAGGSTSPVLRAEAIGQDEELRRATIEDPAAPPSAVYAALAIWRPGPTDSAEMLDRFLQSRDPAVRERAWEARTEATEGLCRHRLAAAGDADALATIYVDCPQLDVRSAVLDRLRESDGRRADSLITATLEAPETEEAGVAAVAAAARANRTDLLGALVERTTVSRAVRALALTEL
jgi:hypothetical protein